MNSDADESLRSGFLRSSERFPDHVALEVAGARITYSELRARAAVIAATLDGHAPRDRARSGESASAPLAAVFGHRSVSTFAGILGILFRGDGYVPLNPTFPADRTRSMLERSDCREVVVDAQGEKQIVEVVEGIERPLLLILPEREDVSELAAALPRHRVLGARDLASGGDWRPAPVDSDAIAYLLFTSGSTGVPKGVMVSHRNVRAFLETMAVRYGITSADRFSQTFELTFDLSVFDLFLAWECGARVCVPSQAQKMLPAKYIQESGLTVWFSVPSTAVLMSRLRLLKPGAFPDLRWSLFCGEAMPVETIEAFAKAAPRSVLENLYGPTELTIACTLYRWDPEKSPSECELGIVPIGDPYPGMEALVVDERGNEVPPGGTGELLMTGPQLSLGYWKDADRTAAAFVRPAGHERTYYRTGDRVRRSRGTTPMVYIGRVDNQIKIQGYRVELGEIEAVVREEADVEVAIAVGWPRSPSGADSVVVFISDDGVDPAEVLKRVRARLPAYMAPREIRCLADFPLNSNGKIDRKALLAHLESRSESAVA